MLNRLERVQGHEGIVAAMAWTFEDRNSGREPTWVGDRQWQTLATEAVRLREVAQAPVLRVIVGEHACLVSGDEEKIVAVVFLKGHPIVKSVARMTRRLLKRPRRTVTPRLVSPASVADGPIRLFQ